MQTTEITSKNLNLFKEQPIEFQVELFNHITEISKLIANQFFQDEVHQKAGSSYERASREEQKYSRWGVSNSGSIKIGDERVKMRIPRLYNTETNKTEALENYKKLREIETPTDELVR